MFDKNYRASTKACPPVPQGFADRFIRDGWRGIERCYGASTPVMMKWIAMSGGEALHQKRRDYLASHRLTAVAQPCQQAAE